jgi:hypothetical protein
MGREKRREKLGESGVGETKRIQTYRSIIIGTSGIYVD